MLAGRRLKNIVYHILTFFSFYRDRLGEVEEKEPFGFFVVTGDGGSGGGYVVGSLIERHRQVEYLKTSSIVFLSFFFLP